MAVAPMDESELLAQRQVVQTVNTMLANPEARKLLLKARKITDPNAVIPEIDAAAPLQNELSEIRKALDEDRAARAKEREEAAQQRQMMEFSLKVDRQKAKLREAGWRDEGIAEIEKFAVENAVPDLEIAASHWEKLHPPAAPVTPSGSGSWNFFDGGETQENEEKFVKAMIESKGEDEGALNREIQAALNDVRSNQSAVRR